MGNHHLPHAVPIPAVRSVLYRNHTPVAEPAVRAGFHCRQQFVSQFYAAYFINVGVADGDGI